MNANGFGGEEKGVFEEAMKLQAKSTITPHVFNIAVTGVAGYRRRLRQRRLGSSESAVTINFEMDLGLDETDLSQASALVTKGMTRAMTTDPATGTTPFGATYSELAAASSVQSDATLNSEASLQQLQSGSGEVGFVCLFVCLFVCFFFPLFLLFCFLPSFLLF